MEGFHAYRRGPTAVEVEQDQHDRRFAPFHARHVGHFQLPFAMDWPQVSRYVGTPAPQDQQIVPSASFTMLQFGQDQLIPFSLGRFRMRRRQSIHANRRTLPRRSIKATETNSCTTIRCGVAGL